MIQLNPLTAQIDVGGAWRIEIALGMVVLTTILIAMFTSSKKISLIPYLLWSNALTSALYVFEYPSLPFGSMNTAFQATAGQAFAELLVIPMFCLMLSSEMRNKIIGYLKYVMIAEIILLWAKLPGLFLAPSFDTAFLALYMPFMPLWMVGATLLTIATHHGATAITIVMAYAFVLSIRNARFRIPALAGTALMLLACFYLQRDSYDQIVPMFHASERLSIYHRMFGFWKQSGQFVAIGTGAGSFMWLSLMIDKFKPPLFLQMHSDWLQILFDLGLVGFILTVITYLMAFVKSLDRPKMHLAVVGAGVFAISYHPLRFFPSAFLIALIFAEVLTGDAEDSIA
jgi:hypothetical protein